MFKISKVLGFKPKVPFCDLRIICLFRRLLDNEFICQWDGTRLIISIWEKGGITRVVVSPSDFTIFKNDRVTTLYINDFILRKFKSILREKENKMFDTIKDSTYAMMDSSNIRSIYEQGTKRRTY